MLTVSDDPTTLASVATPTMWLVTILAVLALLTLDFLVTRRPHEVSMREAVGWSAFYVALPLAFGAWIWSRFGSTTGVEYLTGYLVEKSLSVDNLFVFMLLLTAFAVPAALQQRVLLFGIVGRAGPARHLHRPRRRRAGQPQLGVPAVRRDPAAHRREDPARPGGRRRPRRRRLASCARSG